MMKWMLAVVLLACGLVCSSPSGSPSPPLPSSPVALRERSFAAFRRGDARSAAELLAAARDADPDHFSANDIYNLASLLHDVDGTHASRLYEEAIAAGFERAMHAYHNLGDLATVAGSLDMASEHYSRAMALEPNAATRAGLARVNLLAAARAYQWSSGLHAGDTLAWSSAWRGRLHIRRDLSEVSIWCALAENSTLLISNDAILRERGQQTLSSPCAPPAPASHFARRVCFGNSREGRYIGTSIFSRQYADIPRRSRELIIAKKNFDGISFMSISAFHPETGSVNLDRQRDACGHVVVSMRNARRAARFDNPLRDPVRVCGRSGHNLTLLDGFHRIFEAFSRGYVGSVPVMHISNCSEHQILLLGNHRHHRHPWAADDQALVLARTLLERDADTADREHSIMSATHMVLTPDKNIRENADPELLHLLAKALASLPSRSTGTLEKELARRLMREAERRKIASRTEFFFRTLRLFRNGRLPGASINPPVTRLAKTQRLWSVASILNDQECAHIISLFRGQTQPSRTAIQYELDVASAPIVRTSTTAFVSPSLLQKDRVLLQFLKRVAKVVGMRESMLLGLTADEPREFANTHLEVQVVRYQGQQSFHLHHDAGALFPRVFSMFVYLSTLGLGDGGETCFPFVNRQEEDAAGVCVRPEKGKALLWFNLKEDGSIDSDLRHQGKPLAVDVGKDKEKWGINVFWSLV